MNLHNYQLQGKDHIINNPHCGLFLDMGLGKTLTTLSAIDFLMFHDLEVNRVLVTAPKRVAESVWSAEIEKWGFRFKLSKVMGTERQRKAALAEKADIYIIGRDNLVWLCGLYGGSSLPFDMLVIDELSSFKNPKALRFKALKHMHFKRVVGLTGTPAPNGLIDLWAQMYLIDKGQRLGKTITSYRETYFKPGDRNGMVVFNYKLLAGSEQAIYNKINDVCMSMKAKDYLNLPERIINKIEIKLPANIQKAYNDFERESVLKMFEGKEINAVNAAALTNKLLQFANGAIYDIQKNWHEVHALKLEAVEEIIDEANGEPVLIAWIYQHDRDRLLKRFKQARELKTDKDIKDWNNGETPILLMHPASGGHGLNLQAGGHIIVWFGNTWSAELEQQLNARLDRQGQTKPVIIHKLIAVNTVDTDVIKALEFKEGVQEQLMEALKKKIYKYFVK